MRLIQVNNNSRMKKKISICSVNSVSYVFNNFLKQFKRALQHHSIGQMVSSKQVLLTLSFMGFVDEEPSDQEVELSKTLTRMLCEQATQKSVRRMNLFKFLTVLCNITEKKQANESSYCSEEISGLALDDDEGEEPLIEIKIGDFDCSGRWYCSESEKQQIRSIFASMRAKRISRTQVESRKRSSKQKYRQPAFKPRICPKSGEIANNRYKKLHIDKASKVQNRLLISRDLYRSRIQEELNRSRERELQQCTFKPRINSRQRSRQNKENIRSNSQQHLKSLLEKGSSYKTKKQRLQQLRIKLNETEELQQCTFKPQTTKSCQSTKWVYVRNREKQIERLRQGHQQRKFMNQVRERGYPAGVNWSQFLNLSKNGKEVKNPILCIDLKILNEQNNINVYEGDHVKDIAESISKTNKIPENMWWRVEDLIRKAVEQCSGVKVDNNRIFSV